MRFDNESRRRRHHPEGPGPEFGGPTEHDHDHGHEHGGPRGLRGGRPTFREGHRDVRRGGPRGRAQRGDVRAATLILLSEEPMHGYQLMQAMAERTNGVWRPSPGAIYPTIAQLEDEGLVTTLGRGRAQAGHADRRGTGLPRRQRRDPHRPVRRAGGHPWPEPRSTVSPGGGTRRSARRRPYRQRGPGGRSLRCSGRGPPIALPDPGRGGAGVVARPRPSRLREPSGWPGQPSCCGRSG